MIYISYDSTYKNKNRKPEKEPYSVVTIRKKIIVLRLNNHALTGTDTLHAQKILSIDRKRTTI